MRLRFGYSGLITMLKFFGSAFGKSEKVFPFKEAREGFKFEESIEKKYLRVRYRLGSASFIVFSKLFSVS